MEFGAVIEIISAILAVVGIVCLGGFISEVFFLPREMITAIKIFDERSKETQIYFCTFLKKECGSAREERPAC